MTNLGNCTNMLHMDYSGYLSTGVRLVGARPLWGASNNIAPHLPSHNELKEVYVFKNGMLL